MISIQNLDPGCGGVFDKNKEIYINFIPSYKSYLWTNIGDKAITGLNGDKAPGPDGFPLAFWSFSWDFVKDEVMGFFREFFEHNWFVKSLNATFLVLVPKGRIVEDLKDLRPISLVGSLYKILSEVLANRIKSVMGLIISQSQNAFVEGDKFLMQC